MADLGTFIERLGTAIVWGEASATTVCGGYTVTKTLSLDALADGSARMGESADLGADHTEEILVQMSAETGTAPTAGLTADVFLAWSMDGTNWAAGVTGSDAAWPADGNEDEWKLQLGPPAISLMATNDGNTVQNQNPVRVRVKGRYVAPVYDNNLGQALRDEATASNNGSGVVIWPIPRVVTG